MAGGATDGGAKRGPLNGGLRSRNAMGQKRLAFSTSRPLKSPNMDVSTVRKRFVGYFHFFRDKVHVLESSNNVGISGNDPSIQLLLTNAEIVHLKF
jgi:hypothetical protein